MSTGMYQTLWVTKEYNGYVARGASVEGREVVASLDDAATIIDVIECLATNGWAYRGVVATSSHCFQRRVA